MKKNPVWTIYCHLHVESGRRYVGLTKQKVSVRWDRHVSDALKGRGRGCAYFWSAIRKYGKDAFSHEVLEVCETLEAANMAEEKWIVYFDTRNPGRGFNLIKGGGSVPHRARNAYRSDPEYLESQRLAAEVRWKDPEYQAKTLAATQEAIRTPEVRKNISAGVSALWQDPDYRTSQTEALKAAASDPGLRERLSKNWDDPDFRKRCSSGPRSHAATEAAKTHCRHGHEYTPENTVLASDGHRECKACNYARKKAAKTHCPKGHPYDADNVLLSSSGRRMCAVCLAASKVIAPCKKCGGPKDQKIGNRWRCRPCTNSRIAMWRRSGGSPGDWFFLEADGAFRKVTFILKVSPTDPPDAVSVLAGPFSSSDEAAKARDAYFLVQEVMES